MKTNPNKQNPMLWQPWANWLSPSSESEAPHTQILFSSFSSHQPNAVQLLSLFNILRCLTTKGLPISRRSPTFCDSWEAFEPETATLLDVSQHLKYLTLPAPLKMSDQVPHLLPTSPSSPHSDLSVSLHSVLCLSSPLLEGSSLHQGLHLFFIGRVVSLTEICVLKSNPWSL